MSSGVIGPVVVLKFGSSVLVGADGFREAAREVTREVAGGRRVVAIVSAVPGATDALVRVARDLAPGRDDHRVAELLATAEAASVSLLRIALESYGLEGRVGEGDRVRLVTDGAPLDADPVSVDAAALHAALSDHDAVVLPGFVGVDDAGRATVLGRGGSDLTALFLADALGAEEVRLVKDVDGVYPADPNEPGGPRWPFSFASWERVLDVAGTLVQPKAVRFARERGLRFRVAAPGGRGTWVGAAEEALV